MATGLSATVSAASTYDPDGWDDSAEADHRKALRLIAKTPTLLAMYHRMRIGQELVPPNPKLPHAANFLHMLLGLEVSQEDAEKLEREQEKDQRSGRALDRDPVDASARYTDQAHPSGDERGHVPVATRGCERKKRAEPELDTTVKSAQLNQRGFRRRRQVD